MNIEFIKWMVSYAEGFDWDFDEGDYIIETPDIDIILFKEIPDSKIYYPLLTQRAVIGINKDEESNYDITLYPDSIEIGAYHDGTKDLTYEDVTDYEKGIEQALKYIWEQEK